MQNGGRRRRLIAPVVPQFVGVEIAHRNSTVFCGMYQLPPDSSRITGHIYSETYKSKIHIIFEQNHIIIPRYTYGRFSQFYQFRHRLVIGILLSISPVTCLYCVVFIIKPLSRNRIGLDMEYRMSADVRSKVVRPCFLHLAPA